MNNFDKCFKNLMIWEGGYVNSAVDSGGETKYGISKKSFPNVDIKNLTEEDAKTIYYQEYWLKAKCHLIPHDKISEKLFLVCVNCGVSRGVKIFQECINLSKVAQSVDVDGIIGKRTIQAFNEIVEKDLFLESFSCRIIRFYNAIVDRKKSQSVFLYGWVRRALF